VPPPVKKKAKKWPWILGAIVLIAVVAGIAGGSKTPTTPAAGVPLGSDSTAPSVAAQAPAAAVAHTVIYKVSGTGKASSITYTTDGMTTTNQEADVKLPWTKTLSLPSGQALQMVSIIAQGSGKGTLSIEIEVDGKMFKQASAQGYGVAMANGDIGTLGG
jgi:hypothetical protein